MKMRYGIAKSSQTAVKVFLVAGQSNNFYGASLSAGTDDVTSANLFQYAMATGGTGTANTITDNATNPLGWKEYSLSSTPNAHISYAVKFFIDYYLPANPTHKVVIVPYAVGGSGLYSSGQWLPFSGTYATDAVSKVAAAITAASTYFGTTAEFGGVLWHQGEGDLHNARNSHEYRSNLNGIVDHLRSGISGADAVPFVAGGLSDGTYTTSGIESSAAWAATSTGTMWKNFLSTLSTKWPYAGYADSQSPSALGAATIHFTAAEQRTLAGRYWDAWQAALTNSDPACTWDPYDCIQSGSSLFAFSNGNRDASGNGTAGWKHVKATRGRRSGKRYFEIKVTARADALMIVGIANWNTKVNAEIGNGSDAGYSAGLYGTFGQQVRNFTSVNAASSATFALNDVFGFAVDMDAGKAWIARNNTYFNSGDPAGGTNNWISWTPSSVNIIFPAASIYQSASNTLRLCATTSQQTYSAPSGFTAWSST